MNIGVTQRVVINARGERLDALDQRLAAWVVATGGLPLPIPNAFADDSSGGTLARWIDVARLDAIVLSGGDDRGHAPERDLTEERLLAHAAANRLPVIGICRGAQMMALWAGSTLDAVSAHAGTRHALSVADGETDLPVEVNSFHNRGLRACPRGFQALAWSPDGSIEALRHTDLPWEGWMWHPERETTAGTSELARARRLFAARPRA